MVSYPTDFATSSFLMDEEIGASVNIVSVDSNETKATASSASHSDKSGIQNTLNSIKNLEEELGISATGNARAVKLGLKKKHDGSFANHFMSGDGNLDRSNDSIIDYIKILEKRLEDLEENTKDDDPNEKYPRDCHSFIALNGPDGNGWHRKKKMLFVIGFLVWLLQIFFFLLLILSVSNWTYPTIQQTDNSDAKEIGLRGFFAIIMPSNTKPIIKTAQLTSLLTYLIFPDSSVQGAIKAFQYWPKSKKGKEDDPIWFTRLSCFLRLITATLATFSTFVLVMTSHSVIFIILNFTAMNYISDIDIVAFGLCEDGWFGPCLETHARDIVKKDLPAYMRHERKYALRVRMIAFLCSVVIGLYGFVVYFQESNVGNEK